MTAITVNIPNSEVRFFQKVATRMGWKYADTVPVRRRVSSRKSEQMIKRDSAIQFVKALSVTGGLPVPSDANGIDSLVDEKRYRDIWNN